MLFLIANWKWVLGAVATGVLAVLLATTTIDRNQWRAAARKADATIAKFSDAQKQATAAAQAAHNAQEARYKELADAADTNHATQTASADDAVRAYIASHRVRPNAACPASSAAQGADSGSAEGAVRSDPSPDMVAVSLEDIHICTDNTLRLESAQDWSSSLNGIP